MTHITSNEKIELLKDTITEMYVKQGYPKTRISKILRLDRTMLTVYINKIWKLTPANFTHISKSKEKWINRHRNEIKSKLDQSIPLNTIAKNFGITERTLVNGYLKRDQILNNAYEIFINRIHQKAIDKKNKIKKNSKFNYDITPLPNEVWKPILNYERYYVSNKGRVKKYIPTHKTFMLIMQNTNTRNNRKYIKIEKKGLQVARLVGFAFIKHHSDVNNTIDHIDGNVKNNTAENLRWVSQSKNNKAAFLNGRNTSLPYHKHPKFMKLVIDNVYEFKTIRAFAKFYHVSESQAQRYLNHECKFEHNIKFYY